jgi:hypothetical protein
MRFHWLEHLIFYGTKDKTKIIFIAIIKMLKI